MTRRAQVQAKLLQHFWARWKNDYLTSLREFHVTTGNNHQNVKIGDVVLVHDDVPRNKWRLAVIERLDKGYDGLIRTAYICTSTGRKNRPIPRPYPLEVAAHEAHEAHEYTGTRKGDTTSDHEGSKEKPDISRRPRRNAASQAVVQSMVQRPIRSSATIARDKISQWSKEIIGPSPEDVEN